MIRFLPYFLIVIFSNSYVAIHGQVNNDECFDAVVISDLTDFCSTGLSNVGATPSGEVDPFCWGDGDNESDVWYSFIPRQEGLLLQFFGLGDNGMFTIDNTAIELYEGRCNSLNELQCRANNPDNEFELLFNSLVIGRTHYLRISSENSSAGTFQLCLKQFVPVQEPQQDCPEGVVLCDKRSFVIEKLENGGQDNNELAGSCLGNPGLPSEVGSVWYKWTALNDGTLTFTLTPNNDDPQEDLDFVVYRLPMGIEDCSLKSIERCMASGETLNGPNNEPCFGPTGLRAGETDFEESAGCQTGDNNFLAPLDMKAGESYALVVNNFSESGFGFSIEFGGTGEFLGPEPNFDFIALDNFECDKTITFENLSSSQTDQIVSYEWRFGEGSNPESVSGLGPHDVVYESFGPKVAVLTIESVRGCQVTKVLDVEIEPCCADLSQLQLDPDIQDVSCFGGMDGTITGVAEGGSPEYLYALDGGRYLSRENFNNLTVGTYELSVIDIKGCEVSQQVELSQPEEIQLNLTGPMDTIRLGSGSQFFSIFVPTDRILMYEWSPPTGLSCTDCPNPEVVPRGSSTYSLKVTDQDGCMQTSTVNIFTDLFKPFDAPNIITLNPKFDLQNGIFKVSGNIALDEIISVSIYDRWGGEMYREENLKMDDGEYQGWDLKVKNTGQKVNPGVYVWRAEVSFIDGEVRTFAGTITVIE